MIEMIINYIGNNQAEWRKKLSEVLSERNLRILLFRPGKVKNFLGKETPGLQVAIAAQGGH